MDRQDPMEVRQIAEPVSVEYELTLDDAVEFNAYHAAHSPTFRRVRWWNHSGMALLFLVTGLTSYGLTRFLPTLLYFATAAVVWFVGYPTYARWVTGKRMRRLLSEGHKRGQFSRTTLTLLPDGISQVWDDGESKIKWRGVEKVILTQNKVYLYTGAATAIVVPKNAFATEAALDRFIETAMKYREIVAGVVPSVSA